MAGTIGRTGYRRRVAPRGLPDTATILRKGTPLPDGNGGWDIPEDALAPVACRLVTLTPAPGREAPEAGRVVAAMAWLLLLPWGTDVGPKDRVRVVDRDGGASGTYEVVDNDGVRSEGRLVAVNLKRVEAS